MVSWSIDIGIIGFGSLEKKKKEKKKRAGSVHLCPWSNITPIKGKKKKKVAQSHYYLN